VFERLLHHAHVRRNPVGLFDVVAVHSDRPGVLGIQTTSRANHASRVAKLLASAALPVWLTAGNAAEVWSWGKQSGPWEVRRQALAPAKADPRRRVAPALSPTVKRIILVALEGNDPK
jgi:hypothetical protein